MKISKSVARELTSEIRNLTVSLSAAKDNIRNEETKKAIYWMRQFNASADTLLRDYGIEVTKYDL